ncbi:hypothetical protein ScPMuIL_017888 [Solemya velum]
MALTCCHFLYLVAAVSRVVEGGIWQGVAVAPVETYTACYGIFHENILKPNCSSEDVIAMRAVNSLVKPIAKQCPQEVNHLNVDTLDETCCVYDPGDCGIRHTKNFYRHYTKCTAQEKCELQSAWDIPDCANNSIFMDKTNYMQMEYNCVPNAQIIDVCSNGVVSGQAVYLKNPNYPDRALTKSEDGCRCSVEVSCDTKLVVTALDIRLESTAGFCRQSLKIKELLSRSGVISCSNNNMFVVEEIYRSSSHFVTLELDNQLQGTDGYFWIEIAGASEGSTVTLSCGNSALTTPQNNAGSLAVCPSDLTTKPTGATTLTGDGTATGGGGGTLTNGGGGGGEEPITKPTNDVTTEKATPAVTQNTAGPQVGASTGDDAQVEPWIIAVVVVVLIFLLVVIILLCWDRSKRNEERKQIVPDDTSETTTIDHLPPAFGYGKSGLEVGRPPLKTEITTSDVHASPQVSQISTPFRLPPLSHAPVLVGGEKGRLRRHQSNLGGPYPDPFTTERRKSSFRRSRTQGQFNPYEISTETATPFPDIGGYGLQMEPEIESTRKHRPPQPIPLAKRFTALEISTPDDLAESETENSTIFLPESRDRKWAKLKGMYAFKRPAMTNDDCAFREVIVIGRLVLSAIA